MNNKKVETEVPRQNGLTYLKGSILWMMPSLVWDYTLFYTLSSHIRKACGYFDTQQTDDLEIYS